MLGICLFGIIEIGIGVFTLVSIILNNSFFSGFIVFLFIIMALVSFTLGAGIICRNETARRLLILFSVIILLNKLMIFSSLVNFPNVFKGFVAQATKDIISAMYHLLIIIFFNLPIVKNRFKITYL